MDRWGKKSKLKSVCVGDQKKKSGRLSLRWRAALWNGVVQRFVEDRAGVLGYRHPSGPTFTSEMRFRNPPMAASLPEPPIQPV